MQSWSTNCWLLCTCDCCTSVGSAKSRHTCLSNENGCRKLNFCRSRFVHHTLSDTPIILKHERRLKFRLSLLRVVNTVTDAAKCKKSKARVTNGSFFGSFFHLGKRLCDLEQLCGISSIDENFYVFFMQSFHFQIRRLRYCIP